MLSDEVIEKVSERLIDRIEQANIYVLKKIGKNIKKINSIKPSDIYRLEQILKYGGDYEKIVKKLAEITELNVKDIKKIFQEVAKTDYYFAEKFYKYKNKRFIPFDENISLKNEVNALANLTAGEYVNMSNTSAIGFSVKDLKGKTIFNGLKETYQKVIDEAILNVSMGKSTSGDEIYRLIKELGASGLKTINFASGRSVRLDSAVRMHIKDGIRNLHNELQQQFGKEFDSDGVEISVHLTPAPDHAEVQGRQFSNEEFEKFQNDQDAVDYQGKLFPAEFEGHDRRSISQYNCYHYVFSIVLGVNKPTYTNEELRNIINRGNEKIRFDGKEFTRYEATQMQRALETQIRKQKDIQIMAREAGNNDLVRETQQKITQYTKKYKELSQVSELPTFMERMRVSGYKRVSVPEINISNEIIGLNEDKLNEVLDNKFYNSSKIFKQSKQYLDLTNNENINIYNGTNKLDIVIYERTNIKQANYKRGMHKITTIGAKNDDIRPVSTLWHEMGHALDNYNNEYGYLSDNIILHNKMDEYYNQNKILPNSVKEYISSFKEKAFKEFEETNEFNNFYDNFIEIKKSEGATEWNLEVYKDRFDNDKTDYMRIVKNDYIYRKTKYYVNKEKTDMEYAQITNLSDMFSAISKGKYNQDFCGSYGYHTEKYFKSQSENPTTELFANFISLKMTGSKKHLDFLKKEVPEIYEQLEELYKKIGDDLYVK